MAAQFIGSHISLVSKSDIRYQGVLHSIDPAAATVSLERVRSLGTEGRKENPAEEVPASDTVSSASGLLFIVFRASDVKDLQIEAPTANDSLLRTLRLSACTAAPASSAAPAATSPAQPAPASPPKPAQPQAPGPQSPFLPPPPPHLAGGSPFAPYPPPFPTPRRTRSLRSSRRVRPPPPAASVPWLRCSQPLGAPGPFSPGGPGGFPGQPPFPPQQPPQQQQAPPQAPQQGPVSPAGPAAAAPPQKSDAPTSSAPATPTAPAPTASPKKQPADIEQLAKDMSRANLGQAPRQQQGGRREDGIGPSLFLGSSQVSGSSQGRENQNRAGRALQPYPGGAGGKQAVPVPDTEFDFAKSNAAFQKPSALPAADAAGPSTGGDTAGEGEAQAPEGDDFVVPPPTENFYNPKKSFFDSISSDAKTRTDPAQQSAMGRYGGMGGGGYGGGRYDRQKERERNMEAFGETGAGLGRGGHRRGPGGGGRGRRQGGGGQGGGQGGRRAADMAYGGRQQQQQQQQ
ncbi:hypothetical protein NBRC10512v2_007962 [Rhodotorula toruloides]